jgi:hypothetical protein
MGNIIFAQPIEIFPTHRAFTPTIVSATNADATWPALNLFDYDPYEVYKTTATSTVITINFGSPRDFRMVSLLHCNVTYKTVWTIETSPDNTVWTTLKASGPFWAELASIPGSIPTEDSDPRQGWLGYAHSFYYHTSVVNRQYIRITVTDSDAITPNWMQFGRLFIGKPFQPTVNYAYGSDITITDKSEKVEMPRSAPLFQRLNRGIQFGITLEFLTKTEMETFLYDLSYWAGSNREVFCCLDPDTVTNRHKSIIYGTFEEGAKISNAAFNVFEQKLTITSLY